MLKLDECNQLLVTNPFADDSSTPSSSNNHDTPGITLTFNSLSEHDPLRSRPVSPAHCSITPGVPSVTVTGSEDETRPRLTGLLSLDGLSTEVAPEEDRTTTSRTPQGGGNIIIHPVGPNDSFAGVALRYGVSIAAIRRANQLWPSDPIHLRTELLIPRGDTLRVRHKPTHSASTDTTLSSTFEPTPGLSPDLVVSSFVAARDMILSVFPARISLESLSSKASTSEDHELDDFQTARAHKISAAETPFAEGAYELPILATPRAQYMRPGVPLSSQVPYTPTNDQHLDLNHIPSVGYLRSRTVSSTPTVLLQQPPCPQPFAVPPVRTSQLEPEPAMELPARRSRTNNHHLWTDGAQHQNQMALGRP